MVNEAYGIDEIEEDLIDYVLDISRYLFQEGKLRKTALRKVKDDDLEKYAKIFYDYFSNIYNIPNEYFQVEYFDLNYFIAMKFNIVPNKPIKCNDIIKSKEKNIKRFFTTLALNISIYNITNELYISKVVKGFEEDFFYIIKPNELKSWHRAIAHIDLAEFIDAINRAELEQMMGCEYGSK